MGDMEKLEFVHRLERGLDHVRSALPDAFDAQSIDRRIKRALRDAIPLNAPPDWAAPLADTVLIDWHQLLLEDLEQFIEVFHQRDRHSLQLRFVGLTDEALASQLTTGSRFMRVTRLLAELLTAASDAGWMLPRLDPALFVVQGERIDADWPALNQAMFNMESNRLLQAFNVGSMHPALRKREIPHVLTSAAATSHAFAHFVFSTLARLPSAANQPSWQNQVERFRVYNPHLPAALRDWLRKWLRLAPESELTPLECWQALDDLVCQLDARREFTDVQHDSGAESLFGRTKRGNQNEDALFVLEAAPGVTLLAVADGVSTAGIGTGGQASFVVREYQESERERLVEQLTRLAQSKTAAADAWHFVESFFDNCHLAIVERINRYLCDDTAAYVGDTMSSTLVLALVLGNRAFIGHWGDSRAYVVSSRTAVRLTEDHNQEMGALMSSRDSIYEQPAGADALVNVLGQCRRDAESGTCVPVAQEVSRDELLLQPDEWLLLCSDGLLSGLKGGSDGEKERRLVSIIDAGRDGSCRELARQLARSADDEKGDDNISVVLLRTQSGEDQTRNTPVKRRQAVGYAHS